MILTFKNRSAITFFFFLIALVVVLLEYFNDGVTTHYILHDKDMPAISNWWSLISVPLAAWISLAIMKKKPLISNKELYGFFGGFFFGIIIIILFYLLPDFNKYSLLITFGLALFIPLCTPEYYLGFVLSTMYGFGGVLPVVLGLVIIAIYAIEYHLIRGTFLKVLSKF